jgi:hypothetical protein
MKKMILPLMILPLLFSGCATRRYVDQQCYEARREARQYARELDYDCREYARNQDIKLEARVDDRIDFLLRKSDVGRAASSQTRRDFQSLQEILNRQSEIGNWNCPPIRNPQSAIPNLEPGNE